MTCTSTPTTLPLTGVTLATELDGDSLRRDFRLPYGPLTLLDYSSEMYRIADRLATNREGNQASAMWQERREDDAR